MAYLHRVPARPGRPCTVCVAPQRYADLFYTYAVVVLTLPGRPVRYGIVRVVSAEAPCEGALACTTVRRARDVHGLLEATLHATAAQVTACLVASAATRAALDLVPLPTPVRLHPQPDARWSDSRLREWARSTIVSPADVMHAVLGVMQRDVPPEHCDDILFFIIAISAAYHAHYNGVDVLGQTMQWVFAREWPLPLPPGAVWSRDQTVAVPFESVLPLVSTRCTGAVLNRGMVLVTRRDAAQRLLACMRQAHITAATAAARRLTAGMWDRVVDRGDREYFEQLVIPLDLMHGTAPAAAHRHARMTRIASADLPPCITRLVESPGLLKHTARLVFARFFQAVASDAVACTSGIVARLPPARRYHVQKLLDSPVHPVHRCRTLIERGEPFCTGCIRQVPSVESTRVSPVGMFWLRRRVRLAALGRARLLALCVRRTRPAFPVDIVRYVFVLLSAAELVSAGPACG